MSGFYGAAFSAGAYIGIGLANGMASQLGRVQSIAASLANAAARATAAAAEVKSPSRVFMEIGGYMGEGLAIGIEDMSRRVTGAARNLMDYSGLADPMRLAMAGGGSMSLDESYGLKLEVNPVVSVQVDGREIARATAKPMQKELDKQNMMSRKLKGEY